jgi:hypothetical protein
MGKWPKAAAQPRANHTPANEAPPDFTCPHFHLCTLALHLVCSLPSRLLVAAYPMIFLYGSPSFWVGRSGRPL